MRFTDLDFFANFVGAFEIIGGLLLLFGFFTRIAAISFIKKLANLHLENLKTDI